MSPDVTTRAFEPFFTTKELGKGTGLGLPQVYGFCQQAGGDAQIISHPGVGTMVAMRLPAAPPRAQATASAEPMQAEPARDGAAAPSATATGAAAQTRPDDDQTGSALAHRAPTGATGLDLLLVEDDQEVAEATAAVLNLDGHRVTTAPDAHSALQIYRRHAHYDAVISDVTMPGTMNGIELAIALRDADPDLPVILVTGHTDKLSLAQREGLLVLPKPVNFDALRSALPHAA
ncbi:hypothetical protein DFQ30_004417 [Apophysomyces sp. BC1015]|nr:hypothetical protein DFQ30_004417 [Apophysomyces sp. BC1015]